MNTIELVATSLDEAKDKAAKQLGVDPASVQIEVLEESKGLFGKPGKLTVKAWADEAPAAEAAPAAKEEKPKAKPRAKAKKEEEPAKAVVETEAPKEEASSDEEESEDEREPVEASDEDAEKLSGFLQSLMGQADLDVEVSVTGLNGRYVNINLDGADAGFLVGRRGETLNALQYYMNVVAARQLSNGVRVVLEGDNYREKRSNFLTKMAEDIAVQVRERGEEAVLDALPAFERRIIHQALVDFEGVATYSEGEEPSRRVVIAPAEN